MKETWKDVVGYEGRYEVSDCGRVRSIPRYVNNHTGNKFVRDRIISQHINERGYVIVSLNKDAKRKTFKVHRLVAEAFIENPDGLPEVNHCDGNKENNTVSNLEWSSGSDNQKHAYRTGLRKYSEKSGRKKQAVIQFDLNRNMIKQYDSIKRASVETATNQSNIRECCNGNRKTANGYRWEYAEGEKERGPT